MRKLPKQKVCKGCREKFAPTRPMQEACQPICAINIARAKADKKAKAEKKYARKARKEYYAKDIQWQHKQTQPRFNRMRVLQEMKWFSDKGLEPQCISCGKENMDWACGHFKTVGSSGALRYDEKNTFLQCNRYCNKGLSGNINGNKTTRGYLAGLEQRFGEDKAREIIEYCETDKIADWDCDSLDKFRAECSAEIRRLEALL